MIKKSMIYSIDSIEGSEREREREIFKQNKIQYPTQSI